MPTMTDEELGKFLREPPSGINIETPKLIRWKSDDGEQGALDVSPNVPLSHIVGMLGAHLSLVGREIMLFTRTR